MFNSFHDSKEGEERGKNLISVIRMEDIFVVHLGDLGHKLSEKRIEDLGVVDVLLVPVGGGVTIDAKGAAQIVGELEPSIMVPMHYKEEGLTERYSFLAGVEDFLKSMGGEVATKEKKLKVTRADLEGEETKVVVLEV
jgi:L-ascorbate metabolism protein UlaG (beta-lactamase superfamily)